MFDENAFRAEMNRCGYRGIEQLLSAYNARFKPISQPTLYNKMSGRTDFLRGEILNFAELLGLSRLKVWRIFFA